MNDSMNEVASVNEYMNGPMTETTFVNDVASVNELRNDAWK